MPVVLVRIDDRLVHGQVVEGWLKSIRATHIVVASDSVSSDETQCALYTLAIPEGVHFSCLSLADAAKQWSSKNWTNHQVLVLASNPEDVVTLVQKGAPIQSVNVGGLHFREGRIQVLKAVSLDAKDVESLKWLAHQNIILEARPLPLDEPVNVAPLLDRWQPDGEQPR